MRSRLYLKVVVLVYESITYLFPSHIFVKNENTNLINSIKP